MSSAFLVASCILFSDPSLTSCVQYVFGLYTTLNLISIWCINAMQMKTITIIGTGYVGITTATVLANSGHKVFALDVDESKIKTIKSGKAHFFEKGLDDLISRAINSGSLIPTTSYEESIPESEVIFSCVGTPDREDGSPNLDYIFAAAEGVAEHSKDGVIITQKSTVPVGTGKELIKFIKNKNPKLKFSYVSNPEFLREGSAVYDTFNDRMVVGSDDNGAVETVVNLYKDVHEFAKGFDFSKVSDYAAEYSGGQEKAKDFESRVIRTNLKSAELIKVSANAFLALKISFANNVAQLCDKTGANVDAVMDGIGADSRIGRAFLYAGLGWGGGCFPKDVSGMITVAEDHNVDMKVMKAAVEVNAEMVGFVVEKLRSKIGDLKDKKIAVMGLSFKPGTSDIRNSQSVKLVNELIKLGAKISSFDPQAMAEVKEKFDNGVELAGGIDDAIDGVDAVVIATEWKEFREYDWGSAGKLMKGDLLFDARNCLDPEMVENVGLRYVGVGRN